MGKSIILFDPDRPNEPVEAIIEQSSLTELSLLIPDTPVRFKLHRPDPESAFEGSVDGRKFTFDPSKSAFAALFERRGNPDAT